MSKNSNPTQCDRILDWLSKYGYITQYDAFMQLGIMRLASRISEMRKKYGWEFEVETITVKNKYGEDCRVAKYSLVV